ncbi:hypothetical protein EZY14_001740 [Kordia sp. TARA_039_SRF]|nr:hypothetical protein EZY14_001740 [Kordia sp. TARA_039_SRF]
MSKCKYDVKTALEEYFPSLLKLIENREISWKQINSGTEKHLSFYKEKLMESKESKIIIDCTFYSFIIGNKYRNSKTIPMSDFFNRTFIELHSRLSNQELDLLSQIIKKVLTNFDYKYLNFIGELATLNAYKTTGKYLLLNVEEKIFSTKKSKKADFSFRRNDDGYEFLVEVRNIHLQQRNLDSALKIKNHIENKLREKIEEKKLNLPHKKDVYIQPVVWVESEYQIEIISKLYTDGRMTFKNIFVPMTYVTYRINGRAFEHRFEYVTTILND